ncbi:EI24 domain-containing protein [Streptacidiphilus cavernicola]|uniref:EI24 domain-containing protein n=1 Tax=Streptacidiphilus cavernicola TaxID=3342716 RepID=A0ABV6W3I2_9ACTN
MRQLLQGFRHLLRGQRWAVRHGRWWGFGLLPGLVSLVLYVAALVALAVWSGDLADWITPFADHWSSGARTALRDLTALLLVGGGLMLAVVTFTAVTLMIGEPFYESLSERVEDIEGGGPAPLGLSWWRQLLWGLRDALASVLIVAGIGVLLFGCSFVPVVGQTVVPVVGACVSGFFLTEQLTAVAFQRRGLTFRQRVRRLRGRLPLALGFGVPLVLLFLIPLVAVFAMPGAVAGATLLVRDLDPANPAPAGPPAAAPPPAPSAPVAGPGPSAPGPTPTA